MAAVRRLHIYNYMRSKILINVPFIMILAFAGVFTAAAQDGKQPDNQTVTNQSQDPRANALRELGLSPDQLRQIRQINIERKPLMEDAQRRLREANRALDEAIYADRVNEADVQARLKDLHLAQAEVARLRFMHEFAVRKVLTPEQLVRFRTIRQNFEQARQRFQQQNKLDQGPIRRRLIRQGQNHQRPIINTDKQPQKP